MVGPGPQLAHYAVNMHMRHATRVPQLPGPGLACPVLHAHVRVPASVLTLFFSRRANLMPRYVPASVPIQTRPPRWPCTFILPLSIGNPAASNLPCMPPSFGQR